MERAPYRIEVFSKIEDQRGNALEKHLADLGIKTGKIVTCDNYLINGSIDLRDAERVALSLTSPVTQEFSVNKPFAPKNRFSYALEIGYLPGVTDNVSHTVREGIEDLLKKELDKEKSVFTSVSCFFESQTLDRKAVQAIADELYNPLIQREKILSFDEYSSAGGFGYEMPVVHIEGRAKSDIVDIDLEETELVCLGKEGIKNSDGSSRGPLALDLSSMNVIKKYFKEIEKRNPTDIELESIAQTWSEHCKHTIFSAKLDDNDDGVFKKYIRAATERIRREKGSKDFCRSVFSDNAGGIDFDDEYIVADKVETHNSPSALDPFGGSITGIVGVNRDLMGFGMGSKPIANRYGFCFANPFDTEPLYRGTTEDTKLLSPRRIMDGVIKGVNAGGNQSGIPTPQGFVYFDDRYKGKPLVFVGTIGLIPKKTAGTNSVEKCAQAGDLVVIAGGRVGKDGIHGATFSSEALSSGSPATAVQIGDPITQKKMSDAIVKEARDLGLYRSITDNGAGGISCSVAEMAKESNGFEVDLEKVLLKYPGLSPWEIWISESQERMTFAIQPHNVEPFLALMKKRGVEAAVIGTFTSSGRGIVRFHGETVFDLDLDFLHNGLPRKELTSHCTIARRAEHLQGIPQNKDLTDTFRGMLSRQNIASFEFISAQYDHEVQAGSCVKPLQGKGRVNGNVSVVRPILTSKRGVVLSQAMYPSYSEIDAYRMAACSIDTAVRNAVSAGGSIDHMAILDNFCWCDPLNPERLGQLKKSAEACYDYAVAYGTPFVSGKDSMFNDFRGYNKKGEQVFLSVPPTLLISSFGVIKDVDACQTIDFKIADDSVYIIGETLNECAGSEYELLLRDKNSTVQFSDVPQVDSKKNADLYRAYERALVKGLIASSISIERGGFGVALAKSAMAGFLGVDVDICAAAGGIEFDRFLFSESQGRFLVSVDPLKEKDFEKIFGGHFFRKIGRVTDNKKIRIRAQDEDIVTLSIDEARGSYFGVFGNF